MASRPRAASYLVLDEAARRRRQRKALEALEQDNFHDEPHANLVMHKKAPRFEEALDSRARPERKKRLKSFEYFKQRFRKNLAALLEEEQQQERAERQPGTRSDDDDDDDDPAAAAGDDKQDKQEAGGARGGGGGGRATYWSAAARPSARPPRHLCAVCGFPSSYTCVQCGTRYCCTRCLATHQDTRCLKWTS